MGVRKVTISNIYDVINCYIRERAPLKIRPLASYAAEFAGSSARTVPAASPSISHQKCWYFEFIGQPFFLKFNE